MFHITIGIKQLDYKIESDNKIDISESRYPVAFLVLIDIAFADLYDNNVKQVPVFLS